MSINFNINPITSPTKRVNSSFKGRENKTAEKAQNSNVYPELEKKIFSNYPKEYYISFGASPQQTMKDIATATRKSPLRKHSDSSTGSSREKPENEVRAYDPKTKDIVLISKSIANDCATKRVTDPETGKKEIMPIIGERRRKHEKE